MDKLNLENQNTDLSQEASTQLAPLAKPEWETPTMEDVSEQVMAQPYIRFT